MNNRFIALTGATLFAVAALAPNVGTAQQAAAAPIVISMATLAPNGSTWMNNFEAANREVRRRTSNRVALRWFAGGVQGDEAEVIRKIRSGRLDGAAVTAVGLGQIHRPVLAFQVPGMFATTAGLNRARDALRGDIDTAFSAAGFSLMGFGTTGSPRLFSKNPIRVPSDLRSAHPWQWSDDVILPALYRSAGATGVRLQVPEVLSALQTNRVDAVFGSPLVAVSLQWAPQLRFMSARSNSASLGALVIKSTRLASIPEADRTILREVLAQFDGLLSRAVLAADDRAAASLTSRGIQQVTLSDAEQAQWATLFRTTATALVGTVGDAAWMTRVRSAGN
ncbi:MAG: TRAP transporter substrate-binding protein DctP [Deltaproteobacteria bacterium]|nr:TRAP transporter substrate-binding protein DctP [Deltaproteobacteria bacterium]